MSRYGGYETRSPPVERWTPERFERERGGRRVQVQERDRQQEYDSRSGVGYRRRESSADDFYRGSGPTRDRYEDDRYYEREERYGPPARRNPPDGRERKYHEKGETQIDSFDGSPARGGRDRHYYDDDPRDRRFSGGRGPAPPRPGTLIRRQSSLDTFDRKPARPRYGPGRRRSPEVIPMRGPERQRRHSPRQYEEDDYYEDVRIAEPDRYGDDSFHGWREREVEISRRRRRSSSPHGRQHDRGSIQEDVIEEKPYPRRGKTRMSARLVNKRAIVDLGYPFEEEFTDNGQFVILLKALNKELIDQVLFLSKEYNEREKARITYAIEAPPPPPSNHGDVVERREIIIDKSNKEVPGSVLEWDAMKGSGATNKSSHVAGRSEHGAKSDHHTDHHADHHSGHHSDHKSSHTHRNKSRGRSASRTTIKIHKSSHSRSRSHSHSSDQKQLVLERKPSRHHHHSRHRSHGRPKKEYIEEDEIGESNRMVTGPLALATGAQRQKSRRRSEGRHKADIVDLKIERDQLRKERRRSKRRDRPHHHHHRKNRSRSNSSSSSSSSSSSPEVIIERKGGHGRTDDYKVKEDRKGSDSRIVKGMLATLT